MLDALLRGHLSREQENMEDILTSNVFGLLKYLPAEKGLLPFLAGAEDIDGEMPLAFLAKAQGVEEQRYEFWPNWNYTGEGTCEPDLVLRLSWPGRKLLIVVEAKFHSGKSSGPDEKSEALKDQLAREWDNGVRVAQAEGREPWLVYVTTDAGCPVRDLRESIAEYKAKRNDEPPPRILWLSWRRISEVYRDSTDPILVDLMRLAKRLNLVSFSGFTPIETVPIIEWRYSDSGYRWPILDELPLVTWRYKK